ncbi:MAG: dihydroorotase [Sedimenticola sp.]|uniref:Dihydroorotase n=1 Tax=Sedimenticola thiotaurini TaxID=1543721 RepID=A0A558DC89_9GAMM|nr:dihydroorotase [Sedimenticola sp.]MCW8946249.1 dihydroorotase [Sedimenticola sp.]MCW8949537.1 dihydroorotase [Sedimenticola sp.]MCW8974964.1 dihydroorotase [Sedimenticola sp.]TVT58596.1 MAG: dihydroorotase [Sedimenticola thiotaurini]
MSASTTIQILGGRLIDPANGIDRICDLFILNGKIAAVGDRPEGFDAHHTIDASGQIVCPGLVDLSARMREPGQEHIATISSEASAAAKAGITTLCCPPDTDPVIDSPAVVTLMVRRAKRAAKARLLPIGAMTQKLAGDHLSEMVALKRAGCVAMSNGYAPLANTLVERRALEYAATFGITAILRPEDRHLRNNGYAHEGPVSARLGLPGIPEAAESVAVARDLALAEHTGCRIHFHLLSSGTATRMIEQAQQQRLPVTANVAAHQLHLTEMDIEDFDSNCHLNPPLRSLADRDALRLALAKGVIGAICSDHQPLKDDAKEAPFPSTATGMSGLQTLLPLTLKLVDEGVLPLADAIARVTCGPADILDLPYGRLQVGSSADICIFDPNEHWVLKKDEIPSAGHNTPFIGWEFQGRVTHTLFEGRIVFQPDSSTAA